MAQKVQVVLTDDLDGGPAVETLAFMVDGTSYEIDLSEENAAAFREELRPYVEGARKAGASSKRTAPAKAPRARSAGADLSAVRDWARENGHEVSDRGRLGQGIKDAYAAAH